MIHSEIFHRSTTYLVYFNGNNDEWRDLYFLRSFITVIMNCHHHLNCHHQLNGERTAKQCYCITHRSKNNTKATTTETKKKLSALQMGNNRLGNDIPFNGRNESFYILNVTIVKRFCHMLGGIHVNNKFEIEVTLPKRQNATRIKIISNS